MVEVRRMAFTGRMLHRVAATLLWAYFGWYLTGYLLSVLGVPTSLAVLGGVVMAAVAWVDIRGWWRARIAAGSTIPTAPAER
jgi:hypothetical protein